MNLGVVTTGLKPLVIGSNKVFQLKATLDGLFWDLTGGTASLILKDPTGLAIPINTSIVNGVAQANWTVGQPSNVIGTWTRAWLVADSTGITEKSESIVFEVTTAP